MKTYICGLCGKKRNGNVSKKNVVLCDSCCTQLYTFYTQEEIKELYYSYVEKKELKKAELLKKWVDLRGEKTLDEPLGYESIMKDAISNGLSPISYSEAYPKAPQEELSKCSSI